jgi:hypothetical protein
MIFEKRKTYVAALVFHIAVLISWEEAEEGGANTPASDIIWLFLSLLVGFENMRMYLFVL